MDVAIIIQIPSALRSPGIPKKKKEEKKNKQDGMPCLIMLRVTADRLQDNKDVRMLIARQRVNEIIQVCSIFMKLHRKPPSVCATRRSNGVPYMERFTLGKCIVDSHLR